MARIKVYEDFIWLPVGRPITSDLDTDVVQGDAEIFIPTEPGERIVEMELMKIPQQPGRKTLAIVDLPGGTKRRTALYAYRALVVVEETININIQPHTDIDPETLAKQTTDALKGISNER